MPFKFFGHFILVFLIDIQDNFSWHPLNFRVTHPNPHVWVLGIHYIKKLSTLHINTEKVNYIFFKRFLRKNCHIYLQSVKNQKIVYMEYENISRSLFFHHQRCVVNRKSFSQKTIFRHHD